MIAPGLFGLLAVLALATIGPFLGRRLRPAPASWLLAVGAVAGAATTIWVFGLVFAVAFARLPAVARAGDWTPQQLQAGEDLPTWMAIACGISLILSVGAGVRHARVEMAAVREAQRLTRGSAAELVVLDDPRGIAYAVPGRGRRIVVSTGLLKLLDARERRALIAHEGSHLDHHHGWLVAASRVAAAMNPALRPLADATGQATERWADEDAAREVGDRTTVARAVAIAALQRKPSAVAVPAASGGRVSERVCALMGPPQRHRLIPALVLLALVGAMLGASVLQGDRTDALFDSATCTDVTC
jgi:Zn-dependent protease with chaperone function